MVDVDLPDALRDAVGEAGEGGRTLIAGIRPEAFEDATVLGDDALGRGATFKAKIDVVESMGSEIYAYFDVASDQRIESEELRELAEDSGAGEVPGAGEEGTIVARLSAESGVREGQEAEIFVDASHIQLFDPEDGRSLTAEAAAAPGDERSGPTAEPGTGGRERPGPPPD
ncbi:MAG: hypothetical protein GXY03_08315 [Solirubrobacterales bacterium]|nr:hypothetical protein [Solirubrobacterales bacterium]